LELDPQIEYFKQGDGKGKVSYRRHPGIMNLKRVILPVKLETAINKVMDGKRLLDTGTIIKNQYSVYACKNGLSMYLLVGQHVWSKL
jgi:hypothetical protein